MEAPVTFQSKTPLLDFSFIPCRRKAKEASPSAKQKPGDNLNKFWKSILQMSGKKKKKSLHHQHGQLQYMQVKMFSKKQAINIVALK